MNKIPKTPFGEWLVKEIKHSGLSQLQFYEKAGIKKAYFYDLLRASPPPTDLQDRILKVLEDHTGEDPRRREELYDLAAKGRNEIPADIQRLILENPEKLPTIRKLLSEHLQNKGE